MQLNDSVVLSYRPGKAFIPSSDNENEVIASPTTSIDFEPSTSVLIAASHGKSNALTLFNSSLGQIIQRTFPLLPEQPGANIARFTRRSLDSTILLAPIVPTGVQDENACALHTHSMLSSATIKTYVGHTSQVRAIDQSPVDESFASGDASGEVRIWDARQPNVQCAGVLRMQSSSGALVAYGPNGSGVYVLDTSSGTTYFFSLRKLSAGYERALKIPSAHFANSKFVDLKVSPDGTRILITSNKNKVLGIDSVGLDLDDSDGSRLLFTRDCVSTRERPAQASFTADSRYFCVNGPNGPLLFKSSSGDFLHELTVGEEFHASRICCFSRKTDLLITSDEDATIFWKTNS